MSTVTCHTAGCAAAGVPIELELTWTDPDTGESGRVDVVCCGSCGHLVDDVVDQELQQHPDDHDDQTGQQQQQL